MKKFRTSKEESRVSQRAHEDAELISKFSERREREKAGRVAKAKAKMSHEARGRVEAAEPKGVRGDFVVRDVEKGQMAVFCRFCGEPIALNGKALSNFRNLEIPVDDGSVLASNGCADCVESVDTRSAEALEAILAADVVAWTLSKMETSEKDVGEVEFPKWRLLPGPRRVTEPGNQ